MKKNILFTLVFSTLFYGCGSSENSKLPTKDSNTEVNNIEKNGIIINKDKNSHIDLSPSNDSKNTSSIPEGINVSKPNTIDISSSDSKTNTLDGITFEK